MSTLVFMFSSDFLKLVTCSSSLLCLINISSSLWSIDSTNSSTDFCLFRGKSSLITGQAERFLGCCSDGGCIDERADDGCSENREIRLRNSSRALSLTFLSDIIFKKKRNFTIYKIQTDHPTLFL